MKWFSIGQPGSAFRHTHTLRGDDGKEYAVVSHPVEPRHADKPWNVFVLDDRAEETGGLGLLGFGETSEKGQDMAMEWLRANLPLEVA